MHFTIELQDFFFLIFLIWLSFQWHFPWWALQKNSNCLSCQICFVSSECWALLCHFQCLFQSLEHSWSFNQAFTTWRSWQLIPTQLCGRYIIYFTVHRGILFHFIRKKDHITYECLSAEHSPPFFCRDMKTWKWTKLTHTCQPDLILTNLQ